MPSLRFRLFSALAFVAVTAAGSVSVAAPVINEILASNRRTLADADGAFSDWIELHNPTANAIDLSGWYLTDNATRKTKWQFPAVSLPAGGFLVVFASDKDRRNPAGQLHTNFALSADGEYLGLIAADGTSVVSEFSPAFPSQSGDVAYGRSPSGTIGYLRTPTPGAANSALAPTTIDLPAADGTPGTFTSGLPILVLDNGGQGAPEQAQGKLAGSLRLHAGGSTFASAAELSVRGSSSAEFPKKGFSIELHDADGSNRSAALLGMARVADWALISNWHYDPSHLRNSFLYALSNRLGRWAPQTRFVETFVNPDGTTLHAGHHYGISVLTERLKIHPNLVPLAELSAADTEGEAVTGGYLLKIDPPDDDEFSWVTSRGLPEGEDGYTKVVVASPKAGKLAPAQRDYIRDYVQAFEDTLATDRDSGFSARGYLGYIDRDSWIDYHLLQTFSKNPDGLSRSVYFTKDRGGKLRAGPVWDFDRAMGSLDVRSAEWNEWSEPTDGTPFWTHGWWGDLARDPDFMQAWVDRWQSLRRGHLSSSRLTGLVRSLAGQIDPEAAARDMQRWPENQIRYATHRDEVDHLVSWLTQRATWIDRQFVPAPIASTGADGTRVLAPAGLRIVYTLDGTDPRASGGAVSAGAVTVTGGFPVPAEATATIRLFDPAFDGSTVGSAWSSPLAVVGRAAAPVDPSAASTELAAFSARARLTGPGSTFTARFVVAGTSPRTVVARAVGATLAVLGLENVLADPVLSLRDAEGTPVAANAGWLSSPDAADLAARFPAVGAYPLLPSPESGRDAAVAVILAPGTYTLEIASESGASGLVFAELYAVDAADTLRRLSVGSDLAEGENRSAGFVLGGTSARLVLLRVRSAVGDARLDLFCGALLVAANDDWTRSPEAGATADAAAAAGIAALDPAGTDAALLVRLDPGAYTLRASVKGRIAADLRYEIVALP